MNPEKRKFNKVVKRRIKSKGKKKRDLDFLAFKHNKKYGKRTRGN